MTSEELRNAVRRLRPCRKAETDMDGTQKPPEEQELRECLSEMIETSVRAVVAATGDKWPPILSPVPIYGAPLDVDEPRRRVPTEPQRRMMALVCSTLRKKADEIATELQAATAGQEGPQAVSGAGGEEIVSPYPEHEKLRARKDEADAIARFLQFLDKRDWYICRDISDEDEASEMSPVEDNDTSRREIIGDFLGVNQDKLSAEKDIMVEAYRAEHGL